MTSGRDEKPARVAVYGAITVLATDNSRLTSSNSRPTSDKQMARAPQLVLKHGRFLARAEAALETPEGAARAPRPEQVCHRAWDRGGRQRLGWLLQRGRVVVGSPGPILVPSSGQAA